ncbi:MAG: protein-glutamate O-methyltransferase CheR [Candidatus Rokubacteria bacterium]|nr:protein-glutamate O-methyltransferase CheR [Candidatus Rokubacteria bacterium]
MSAAVDPLANDLGISDREFQRFRTLVHERAGIALGPHKRHLLRARLGRRLRALGLASFGEYYDHLMDPATGPQEMTAFINAITTNKTDFFREPHHFTYLAGPWADARRAATGRGPRRLRLWSAACSTGEEVYTLVMTLAEARLMPPAWDVRILASDIDTDVLAQTESGIYTMDRATPIPPELLKRYFLRRRTAGGAEIRVRNELRGLVAVRRINLAEAAWPIRTQFDVIFCRNALIYFDRDMQRAILGRLVAHLVPGGLLFLGHAESVFGLVEGLVHMGNTIYTWRGGARGPS